MITNVRLLINQIDIIRRSCGLTDRRDGKCIIYSVPKFMIKNPKLSGRIKITMGKNMLFIDIYNNH